MLQIKLTIRAAERFHWNAKVRAFGLCALQRIYHRNACTLRDTIRAEARARPNAAIHESALCGFFQIARRVELVVERFEADAELVGSLGLVAAVTL